MSESIIEIENRLKGLDIEKVNLKKTEEDIKVISSAAKDVNNQIKYIASVKDNFSDISKKVTFFSENIDNLNSQFTHSVGNFEDKLRERSRELTEEFCTHVDNLRRDFETKISESGNLLVDGFRIKLSPLIRNVESADTLHTQIANMKETFNIMENTFFDEFKQKSTSLKTEINDNIDKLTNRLNLVEMNIDDSKGKLISTFENEVDKVRTEIDNLSIHAVSKKDEIVQAVRKESEIVKNKIEGFDDKFIVFENSIDSNYQSLEARFNNMLGRLKDEETNFNRKATEQIDILQKGFSDLENRLSEVRRANDAVSDLTRSFENAQREAKEFERFVADIDQIKGLKKVAETELKKYYANKEKLSEIEGDMKSLIELNSSVVIKSDELFNSISRIDSVKARIDGLSDMYNAAERRIHELHQYEDIISQNLSSISKSEIIIQTIDNRIKAFEKVIDRSDKRIEKIGNNIKNVEAETINLKTKESDIRELRDRLNELDGLSDHLEERVKQIYAMFSKVEAIKTEIDRTDNKLQDMFHQTDMKMREFSDFIQAVDKNNPILKQVKGDIDIKMMPAKNLSENIVKTVRELSKKGWGPEAISKKLMVDENSVRFIINTTSL
jgi:DNA repair exonuclease SbcCD ATPase subunit